MTAIAYAIDRGDEKQRKFQSALRQIGFTVKLKPFIQRSDGSAKGDWDVGITIDVLETTRGEVATGDTTRAGKEKAVDSVILLSGDGDFDVLLQKINQDYKVTTEVYGVPSLTANSLIESATVYHPIESDLLI